MLQRPLILLTALATLPIWLAACGGGGGGGAASSSSAWPTATFSGRVTMQGTPLQGVNVIAVDANTNGVFGTATTDANGNYSFTGMNTSCTNSCTQFYEIFASKSGYAFYPTLTSNPSGNRSAYLWDTSSNTWYIGNGATVTRASHNGLFVTGSGAPNAVFTVFKFASTTAGANGPTDSVNGGDFVAYSGANSLAHLAASGQSVSYAAGDDAAVHAGVAWPSTRFTDNSDGTVTDHLTGLIWLKDAGCLATATWSTAITNANALANGSCGLSDGTTAGQWRMPNQWELESLIDESASSPALPAGSHFVNVSSTPYWTSTSYYGGVGGSADAWAIRLSDGRYINDGTTNDKAAALAVWAVKGAGGGAVDLQATGFYVHYLAGDDGSVQSGVPLTFPRMVDNVNGTVTDTVTGLVWLKQADCINGTWSQALAAIGNLANGQCGLSDGSTPGQWRMPNRKEMASLADRAQNNQADFFDWSATGAIASIPPMNAAFTHFIQFQYYWTSTTNASATTQAWTVFSCDYGVYETGKSSSGYALAVRDGP